MVQPQLLKTFLALAETLSFTGTARRLAMTQPGVSQHLKRLEEALNVTLVTRTGKNVQLTEAGRKLREYGARLFTDFDQFSSRLGDDDPTSGVCRLASPGSVGMRMYSLLLELNAKHRGLRILFQYSPNATILREVLDDSIDVGIGTLPPTDPRLEASVIAKEKLLLVLPAGTRDRSFEGLKKLGFIGHPDGFHYAARLLESEFPSRFRTIDEFPLNGFINQVHRILEPVSLGLGFTALPRYACETFSDQRKISYFPTKRKHAEPVYWITKKGKHLPKRYDFLRKEISRREWN